MGTHTTVTLRRPAEQISEQRPTKEDIFGLATFCDQNANAISFCFGPAATPNKSHREDVITIKKLAREAIEKFRPEAAPESVLSDLDGIKAVAEEIQANPTGLRVVFACAEQHIWKEFHLAVQKQLHFLHLDRRFRLAPLMQALQSAAPYCVIIVESGKARVFIVHGTDIQELPGRLPKNDLQLNNEDNRVGWSRHIDKNQAEHEHIYFKNLLHQVQQILSEHHISQLIIGVREDLWGEIESQFAGLTKDTLIGRFHLSSFDMTPPEVLHVVTPIFAAEQQKRVAEVLQEARELPSRGVFGIDDVLKALLAGRVRTLILEETPARTLSECRSCGEMMAITGKSCTFCGSSELCPIPAEEALVRVALLRAAEILFIATDAQHGFNGAAGLLRY